MSGRLGGAESSTPVGGRTAPAVGEGRPCYDGAVQTPPETKLVRLEDADADDIEALAGIYEEAIPASERKPLSGLLADPACRFILAKGAGGLTGFAIVRQGAGADLLEYIAVAAEARGGGLGGRLYGAARALAGDGGRPLLIEVDSDREAAADLETRVRRKGFYRRLGARQIEGLAYLLPLDVAGPPPEMDLMIDRCPHPSVRREVLGEWLADIYSGAYGRRRDDPRIGRMLQPLGETVAIV